MGVFWCTCLDRLETCLMGTLERKPDPLYVYSRGAVLLYRNRTLYVHVATRVPPWNEMFNYCGPFHRRCTLLSVFGGAGVIPFSTRHKALCIRTLSKMGLSRLSLLDKFKTGVSTLPVAPCHRTCLGVVCFPGLSRMYVVGYERILHLQDISRQTCLAASIMT